MVIDIRSSIGPYFIALASGMLALLYQSSDTFEDSASSNKSDGVVLIEAGELNQFVGTRFSCYRSKESDKIEVDSTYAGFMEKMARIEQVRQENARNEIVNVVRRAVPNSQKCIISEVVFIDKCAAIARCAVGDDGVVTMYAIGLELVINRDSGNRWIIKFYTVVGLS